MFHAVRNKTQVPKIITTKTMKKQKCVKCGIYYNERTIEDHRDKNCKILCWNCAFIWECLLLTVQSLSSKNPMMTKPLNREVSIDFDSLKITKSK